MGLIGPEGGPVPDPLGARLNARVHSRTAALPHSRNDLAVTDHRLVEAVS